MDRGEAKKRAYAHHAVGVTKRRETRGKDKNSLHALCTRSYLAWNDRPNTPPPVPPPPPSPPPPPAPAPTPSAEAVALISPTSSRNSRSEHRRRNSDGEGSSTQGALPKGRLPRRTRDHRKRASTSPRRRKESESCNDFHTVDVMEPAGVGPEAPTGADDVVETPDEKKSRAWGAAAEASCVRRR